MSFDLVLKSTRATFYGNGIAEFTTNFNNFFPEDESYNDYELTFSFISDNDNALVGTDLFSLEIDVRTNVQIIGTANQNLGTSNAGAN